MAQSDYLFDVFVRQQTQLEGLKAKYVQEFDDLLVNIRDEIHTAIVRSGVHRINQLDQASFEYLLSEVERLVREFIDTYEKTLTGHLEETSNHEFDFILAAIALAVVDKELLRTPNEGDTWKYVQDLPVQATGQLLSDFLATWKEKSVASFGSLLRNARAQGWEVSQVFTAIQGTRQANYTDGLLGKLYRDTVAVIKTTVQHASNAARALVYLTNTSPVDTADGGYLLIGYRWISVLDDRTTPMCRSLDGQVFRVGEGPLPPLHMLCRSTTMPEFENSVQLLENSTRPSMFGPVRGSLTYYQWLSLQPAWFQDRVLGPTRGKLFRDGGLSAEEFARLNLGRTFEPLTLEEMRRRWPEIFEQAGL